MLLFINQKSTVMPGGGVLHHMVTVIKNNSRKRERARFDRRSMEIKASYKKGKIEKKTTPQQLKEIRERLQKENKRNRVFAIVFVTTFIVILYILFNFAKF